MTNIHHNGSCLCGDTKFQASGPPLSVALCHCASCRKHTGAPASIFADYKMQEITFTKAKPKLYESSKGVFRGFCPSCGSTISYQGNNLPDMIHIHTGVFEDPSHFIPTQHENVESKPSWLCVSITEEVE